jgi:phosphohistidine phosphatase SixA
MGPMTIVGVVGDAWLERDAICRRENGDGSDRAWSIDPAEGPRAIGRRLGASHDTECASGGTVMIVGHNPGLEELVAQLTGEQQDLPTAALGEIGLPIDRWRDLKVSTRGLLGLWRPKELT